ncbi:MAG TPA: hypothetical protein PLD95_00220 [bacterium]|jgi:hypothetical protein|nr:hypothetical protein [bacterium]HOG37882.1 hypothetical protein [bacterium]HQI03098.1 hypothetical protein [bacterium]
MWKSYTILIIALLWIIPAIFYISNGAWKIRKNLMKKFASKLNLNFNENSKIKKYYKIEGLYKNKNISIEESLYHLKENENLPSLDYTREGVELFTTGSPYNSTHKRIVIKVDNKIIYNRDKDVLLPTTNKTKKIIDQYIESGKISNTNILNKIGLFVLICASLIPLVYIFITFILN